jgi:hypothetical protein
VFVVVLALATGNQFSVLITVLIAWLVFGVWYAYLIKLQSGRKLFLIGSFRECGVQAVYSHLCWLI